MDLTDEEWRRRLTPAQYRVLRRKGTERPFTGDLLSRHDDGSPRVAPLHAQDVYPSPSCQFAEEAP